MRSSNATTLEQIIDETLSTILLRQGRLIDIDSSSSMEEKERGVFLVKINKENLWQKSKSKRQWALRFITCGSVDDGKSTLIGRLLYEANLVYEDQLKALDKEGKFGLKVKKLTSL